MKNRSQAAQPLRGSRPCAPTPSLAEVLARCRRALLDAQGEGSWVETTLVRLDATPGGFQVCLSDDVGPRPLPAPHLRASLPAHVLDRLERRLGGRVDPEELRQLQLRLALDLRLTRGFDLRAIVTDLAAID
jgi:hypothetical protein